MHLLTTFVCAHGGMTSQRASWDGKFATADKGVEAFDSFARNLTSKRKRKDLVNLFPTFAENKNAMTKIGRKMAKKFTTSVRSAVTRQSIDLRRFV